MITSLIRKCALAATAGIALTLGAAPAFAVDVYTFNATAVGAFGAGPYGTVTLTQNASDVDFSVVLRPDLNFVKTGNDGSKSLFTFNATGVAVADIGPITFAGTDGATFAAYGPANNSPYGAFTLGIHCTASCPGGLSQLGFDDPLTFKVANATLGDFGWVNSAGASFSADVGGADQQLTSSGATGAIAVTAAIPEPETYALMLAGLGAVGFMARRRRHHA